MDLKIEVKMKNWRRCKVCEEMRHMQMDLNENRFCPKCGRPLTKDAFTEFGDRIVEVIIGGEREL